MKKLTSLRAFKHFPLIALFITIGMTLLFGHYGFPIPTEDPAGFVPVAVNLRGGHGLYAQANLGKLIDKTHQDRFLFYPPLYPYVLSLLMTSADVPSAFMAIAYIEVLNLIFLFLLIGSETPLLTAFSLFAFAGLMSCGYGGRPETLGISWMLLGMLACKHLRSTQQPYVLGLLLGLMAATHPVGSIFSAFLVGCWCSYKDIKKNLFLIYGLGAVVFWAVLYISPWPMRDVLSSMARNGHLSTLNGSLDTLDDVIRFTFFFTPRPFIGLIYLLPSYFAIRYFKSTSLLYKSFLYGFLFVMWWFGFRIGVHMYNAMVLLPVMLWTLNHIVSGKPQFSGLALVCVNLVSITFFRFSTLLPFYLHYGMTLSQARMAYADLQKKYPSMKFNITTGLWVLGDRYEGLYNDGSLDNLTYHLHDPQILLLVQQVYMGFKSPPAVKGYDVVENLYVQKVPRLLGIKIANGMPGYQFALYKPSLTTKVDDPH